MTIRRSNPRKQGEIGLGAAIGWFTANDYLVAIPLCDNQPYDLIVDDGNALQRVQVKTTTSRGPYGNFVAKLETAGGNQSFHTRKPWDSTASDLLFILTDEGDIYVFPSAAITNRRTISLCEKYQQYWAGSWPLRAAPRQLVVGEGFEPS
jgi:hypothetical protein